MNSWTSTSYRANIIEENIKNKKFIIPRYQRGIVWDSKQQNLLIDTIKKGLPFGTILLYHDEAKNKYQIIDGLQRCHTIFEFINNPAQFFCEADISDGVIKEIVRIINVNGDQNRINEIVKDLLIDWVKNEHDTMRKVEGMQFYEFAQYLSKKNFPSAEGHEIEISNLIKEPLNKYQDICKTMMSREIPAIIIEGDDEQLPDIFERINSEGTKLTKYEIFAASWTEYVFHINDDRLKDIITINRDRYDVMLDEEYELDDYDSTKFIKKKELNAFEIAFGFGKFISKNYKHLFDYKDEEKNIESVGFNLINCCLGMRSAELKTMHKNLYEKISDKNINQFIIRILECVEFVNKQVSKFNLFKANKRSNITPLHTEFQIISMIASVFIIRHMKVETNNEGKIEKIEIDLEHRSKRWNEVETLFKRNASKKYIIDILYKRWLGSGDRKLDNIFFDPEIYSREIKKDEFISNIDQWFKNIYNERREYMKIPTPKEPEKIFLILIYLTEFSAMDHLDNSKYDIEHLATKSLMKKQLSRFEGNLRLPISSIGNLCMLPEKTNRTKRDHTIYRDKKYIESSKISIKEIEEKYTFTNEQDLTWLYDRKISEDELDDKYNNFVNKRFSKMINIIEQNYSKI